MSQLLEKISITAAFIVLVVGVGWIATTGASTTGFTAGYLLEDFNQPAQFTLGGECLSQTDCVRSGCYGEYCGNALNAQRSSCSLDDDFPHLNGYECKCYQNKCMWE